MSGNISFTGIGGGGGEFNQIIDALVQARRKAVIEPMEDWKKEWEGKIETVNIVDSVMSSFFTLVKSMDRITKLKVQQADSSDPTTLTASASSTAVSGSHEIVVNQLARAEKRVHLHGELSENSVVNATGEDAYFKYVYNGKERSVKVPNNTRLVDLVNLINADPQNPGVKASLLNSGGKVHLVMAGNDMGKDITFSFAANGLPNYNRSDFDAAFDSVDFSPSSPSATRIHRYGEASLSAIINETGGDLNFEFIHGTDTHEITVPDGTILYNEADPSKGLAQLINAVDGVTASIRSIDGKYHLEIASDDSNKNITIVPRPSGDGVPNYNVESTIPSDGHFTKSVATQAQIRVDGFPPPADPLDPDSGPWITRDTNTISDIIPGLTLTLVSEGSVNLTVATNKEAIMDKVEEFREKFNEVRSIIRSAGNYDPIAEQAGPLMGNYALQIVKARLDSIMNSVPPGFKRNVDSYSNMMQLGFYTDANQGSETQGLLLLDRDKLSEALDKNPDAVASLLSGHMDGSISNSTEVFFSNTLLDLATPGIYDVEIVTTSTTGFTNGKGRFKLENGSWSEWFGLEGSAANNNLMLTASSGDARGVSLRINPTDPSLYDAANPLKATLQLRNGVITEVGRELNRVLSPSTLPSGERVEGPLKGIVKNYTDIIKTIDKRVESEERRIEAYEVLLRQRFARLDSLMGRMGGMSAALGGIVQNMNK